KGTEIPMVQGKETTGANSISVYDYFKKNGGKQIIIVGGDFKNDSSTTGNCIFTHDGGATWKKPSEPPHGYRSCVEYLSKQDIVSCGLNGIDYSINGGKNWKWISKEGFHVCRIAKYGSSVFLAGANGRIGKLNWE
ncbi:MAG: oxidoreductase, partial [Bacteroidota bacterium]